MWNRTRTTTQCPMPDDATASLPLWCSLIITMTDCRVFISPCRAVWFAGLRSAPAEDWSVWRPYQGSIGLKITLRWVSFCADTRSACLIPTNITLRFTNGSNRVHHQPLYSIRLVTDNKTGVIANSSRGPWLSKIFSTYWLYSLYEFNKFKRYCVVT